MTNKPEQPELQQSTLRLYGELLCHRSDWAGQLAFAAFSGAAASGFAAASSLAGAASLTADGDAAFVKAHFRDGAFDFVVNTLDEALRALKNEIRRARPIAIGLIADPSAVIHEAAERGLAAALLLADAESSEGLEERILQCDGYKLMLDGDSPSLAMQTWLEARGWQTECLADATAQGTKDYADALHDTDVLRARWLRQLPSHQRSVMKSARCVWMTADESDKFAASTPR